MHSWVEGTSHTMAIVKCVAVLFRQHDQAMESNKHSVCPWPVSMIRPPDNGTKVEGLPGLVRLKFRLVNILW